MRPPAFLFYAGDFLAGTADMTNEEVGAYTRLLAQSWDRDGLPNDPVRLSIMAGAIAQASLGHVLCKFRLYPDGKLRNDRLEAERAKQVEYRQKQASKGRSGASKRWPDSRGHSRGHSTSTGSAITQGMPVGIPRDSIPSPSPDGETEEASASLASPPSVKTIATPEQIAARFAEMTAIVSANGHSLEPVAPSNASESLTPTETAPHE